MELTREAKLAKWGPGPWIDEPDHVEWRHNGVPCILHRQTDSGHWCGYAAVEPGHPWHGKSYADKVPKPAGWDETPIGSAPNYIGLMLNAFDEDDDATVRLDVATNVHGGITYAEPCQGAVCHVPQPGEPADVWWLGFDCHHSCDGAPPRLDVPDERRWLYDRGGVYRTESYVRRETECLAEQVIAARVPAP